MPRLPSDYATWLGRLSSCGEFANQYAVDEVRYVDEVSDHKPIVQCFSIRIYQKLNICFFPRFNRLMHSLWRKNHLNYCCW